MTDIFKLIFSAFLNDEGKLTDESKQTIKNFMFGFVSGIVATILALVLWVE